MFLKIGVPKILATEIAIFRNSYFQRTSLTSCYCILLMRLEPEPLVFENIAIFLLYTNDLPQTSKLLDPIMFTDDTNLFYSGKDIHLLFNTVNNEFSNIGHLFNSNKISLNADKLNLHYSIR